MYVLLIALTFMVDFTNHSHNPCKNAQYNVHVNKLYSIQNLNTLHIENHTEIWKQILTTLTNDYNKSALTLQFQYNLNLHVIILLFFTFLAQF